MFFKLINLINFILILIKNVAGQNPFLPAVLDAIPSPLLQDLPGNLNQYGMAFNGQFGQRYPPHLRQEAPEQQVITYQPLLELGKPDHLPDHLNLNAQSHHSYKNRHQNHLNPHSSTIFGNQRQQNNNDQPHLINDNLNDNNFEIIQDDGQNENQNDNNQQQKTSDKDNIPDPLEALIPHVPKKDENNDDKNGDDLSNIPDPLAENTPLGRFF